MPEGMREVSHEEFWRLVMSEKRDIHPSSQPRYTEWFVVGTRRMWGWTSGGYSNSGRPGDKHRHAVATWAGNET